MRDDHHRFSIGPEYEHLSVRLLGRSHPAATDYWDGNWIRCRIAVHAHPFGGEFTGDLRTDELSGLRDDLARLHSELAGEAAFANLDGHLTFDVSSDGMGRFTLNGVATHEPGSGRYLAFRIHFDQSDIPKILADLDDALSDFPVKGNPDE